VIAAEKSFTGKRVGAVLDSVARERGYPKTITVDNGSEFYSKAYRRNVKLDFIRPGKPVENAFIESFNKPASGQRGSGPQPRIGPSAGGRSPMVTTKNGPRSATGRSQLGRA